MMSQGAYMQQEQVTALRESLSDAFGLNGTILEQYFGFLRRILISQDFGPSLAMYPTPVRELIAQALPWTFGLLLCSVLIAWLIGNAHRPADRHDARQPRLEGPRGRGDPALSDPLLHPGARAQHPVQLRVEDLPADHHGARARRGAGS